MLSPVSVFGALIPTCFWNPGLNWQWEWRNQGGCKVLGSGLGIDHEEVYSKYGLQTISVLAYLSGQPTIYTISMDMARQFLSVKGHIEKPEETTLILR
jgi:hypothetical protein